MGGRISWVPRQPVEQVRPEWWPEERTEAGALGRRGGMGHPMGNGLQERRPDQETGKGHRGPGASQVAPVRGRAVSRALLTHLHSQSAYSVPEAVPGTWVATT